MKLVRFSGGDAMPRFGVVIGNGAIAFAHLLQRREIARPDLSNSRSYLSGLPASSDRRTPS